MYLLGLQVRDLAGMLYYKPFLSRIRLSICPEFFDELQLLYCNLTTVFVLRSSSGTEREDDKAFMRDS